MQISSVLLWFTENKIGLEDAYLSTSQQGWSRIDYTRPQKSEQQPKLSSPIKAITGVICVGEEYSTAGSLAIQLPGHICSNREH